MSEGQPWDVQISFWQGFSDRFYDYTGKLWFEGSLYCTCFDVLTSVVSCRYLLEWVVVEHAAMPGVLL